MKHLVEDGLKLGGCVQELLMRPTPIGRLHTLVRIARPNWSPRRCLKAACWMKKNGLKSKAGYNTVAEYQGKILALLGEYARATGFLPMHQEADELSLARWEDRWRRARSRLDFTATDDETNEVPGARQVA